MLRGLDAVAWGDLSHAYGEADDVPGLLRGLADGEDAALHRLHGTIWHQGTVYEATAAAVPFLIEILDAPGADTAGVLHLLASIAGGSSYLDVHRAYLPASRRDTAEVHEQLASELAWVAAARAAVTAGRPACLRLLAGSADPAVRAAAAYALAALDPDDATATALLARAAGDPSPLVRAAAVLALGAPAALDDPDPLPRLVSALLAGADVLAVVERDAPAVLPALRDLPWEVDEPLAWVLGAFGHDWRAQVRLLTAWLRHPDPEVRAAAAFAAESPVRDWRPAAAPLVPALTECLTDPSPAVRRWAAVHLSAAGHAAAEAADTMWALAGEHPAPILAALAFLQDPRADTLLAAHLAGGAPTPPEPSLADRFAALRAADAGRSPTVGRERALREHLTETGPTLPALRPALDLLGPWATACRAVLPAAVERAAAGPDRAALIRALARVQPPPPSPIPHEQPDASPLAAARIQPPADASAPDQREGPAPDPHAAALAPDPREQPGPGPLSAGLVPVLCGQLASHPVPAAEALASLGPAGVDAVADLAALLGHEDPDVALAAAGALHAVTGDPAPVLAAARAALESDRPARHMRALPLLARCGPAAASLAPLLRPLIGGDDEWLSMRAAIAHWHLTGDPAPTVPVLMDHALAPPRGLDAVRCLGEIGPAAAAAAPLLREALASPHRFGSLDNLWGRDDDRWREAAEEALRHIAP